MEQELRMRARTTLLTIWLLLTIYAADARPLSDSLSSAAPSGTAGDTTCTTPRLIHRLGAEASGGYVFPTNSSFKGNAFRRDIKFTASPTLKYAFQFDPNSAASRAYAGAYQGIGLGYFHFSNQRCELYDSYSGSSSVRNLLGTPVALYLFQGGRIAELSPRLSLNYEWNFGASFGWNPYDEDSNTENTAIGTKTNAYLNVCFYLNYAIAPGFDLTVGATGTHFSNGNTRYPNAGVNMVDGKIGLAYYFNRRADGWKLMRHTKPLPPPFLRHVSYDLALFGAWRRKLKNLEEGQALVPGSYGVAGFCLAPMYNFGYKFRAGVSLDGVYDHSANLKEDEYGDYHQPSVGRQMALGLSARGELVMPYFTVGIGLGGNILHSGGDLKSFYQILVLKIDVTRHSYLHIGYNLRDFSDPNYLMLGIGFRFHDKRPRLY